MHGREGSPCSTERVVIAGVPEVRLIESVSDSSDNFVIHFSVSIEIDW